MDFLLRVPEHIYKTPAGEYISINVREYREFVSDADTPEWDKDYAEIDAFEAPLFDQGLLTFVEYTYDPVQFPDGSMSPPGEPTGYTVRAQGPGPEKPDNLFHPLYKKWEEKMKADPNLIEFRNSYWIE